MERLRRQKTKNSCEFDKNLREAYYDGKDASFAKLLSISALHPPEVTNLISKF